MKYIEQQERLSGLLDLTKDEVRVDDHALRIVTYAFHSCPGMPETLLGREEDSGIAENQRFRYPVFVPGRKSRFDHAILYLHGLNERSWQKHLAGARLMAETTGKAVILFPLSFHINRGLPEWSDARKMAALLDIRKKQFPGIQASSIVNLALSDRLTRHPQRFFLSGMQSAMDLIRLIRQIHGGEHPLFEKNARIDLFAYSISCMVLQSLMMSKVSDLLDRSRLVFFAGGSVFSHLQGVSKFILDSVSFDRIRMFYSGLANKEAGALLSEELRFFLLEHDFGRAFQCILSPEFHRREREEKLAAFNENMMVIALQEDKIIPVEGIRHAVGEKFFHSNRFNMLHFPYPYTHENPFPVLYRKIEGQVDQSFHSVYQLAVRFYMEPRQIQVRKTA